MAEEIQQGESEMSAGSQRVKMYIFSIVILSGFVVIGMLGVTAIRPTEDNLPIIAVMIGLFTPIVTALLAAALKENHDLMNSRLSQLLAITEKSSKAEGKLEGKVIGKLEGETRDTLNGTVKATIKP